MNKISYVTSHFNPFAKNPCSNRGAVAEFRDLNSKSQAKVVALTIIAFIGTLFILGAGAVATFRILTHKFSVINPNQVTDSTVPNTGTSTVAKTGSTFTKVINQPPVAPTIGFPNYGSSCWLGSAMQALLACKHFEGIVSLPLKPGKSDYSEETDDEFQKRKIVQTALIEVIHIRRNRDSGQIKEALEKLHQAILHCNEGFTKIGNSDNSDNIFCALKSLLDTDNQICRANISLILYPSKCKPEALENFKLLMKVIYKDSSPQMITVLNEGLEHCNLDAVIDLSNYFENTKYKIVGITKIMKNHSIAYIRNQDGWYCCDDSKVTKVSLTTMDLGEYGECNLVLERQ